jgi:hypothetical protein
MLLLGSIKATSNKIILTEINLVTTKIPKELITMAEALATRENTRPVFNS